MLRNSKSLLSFAAAYTLCVAGAFAYLTPAESPPESVAGISITGKGNTVVLCPDSSIHQTATTPEFPKDCLVLEN